MSGEPALARNCSAADCGDPARKRGMCNKHYLRWWKATPPEERGRPTAEQRFWAMVIKSPGCWEWRGTRRPTGHGQFAAAPGRTISAAEFALELALGYPAPEGLMALHRCDNPPCVNPKHLYYGTRQDNSDDAWARGLMPVGSQRANTRLNESQVVRLREVYAAGADARALATEYGIAVSTLRLIVLGRKWPHVGGPITRRRPKRQPRQKVG